MEIQNILGSFCDSISSYDITTDPSDSNASTPTLAETPPPPAINQRQWIRRIYQRNKVKYIRVFGAQGSYSLKYIDAKQNAFWRKRIAQYRKRKKY